MYFLKLHKLVFILFTTLLFLSSSVNAAFINQTPHIITELSSSASIQNKDTSSTSAANNNCCLNCKDCSHCQCCQIVTHTNISSVLHIIPALPLKIASVSQLAPIEAIQDEMIITIAPSIYRPPIA
ncbi:hypothetical protein CZ809_02809 [Photobacterium piscicola]|uniref:DUF2946 domain-containing protein n=1 Tax=Photobacterium piscicola TaxID=1378299 RepID=A0A1T5I264_9GAMM|nr:hypothetical protein CZ809_02809 [Photobacterium piscicola]